VVRFTPVAGFAIQADAPVAGFAIQADAPVAGFAIQADAPVARVVRFAPLSLTSSIVGELIPHLKR
jgi:hypothetical protein